MSNDINLAIQFAVDICNNESHGYSNGEGYYSDPGHTKKKRDLNPDTDCSGLVYYSLRAGGFSVPSSIWYTGDMMTYLRNMGFTEYIYSPSNYSQYVPQHGDICVHREGTPQDGHGHAMFYAENVMGFPTKNDSTRSMIAQARVEAIKDYNNLPGDSQSSGAAYDEVWAHNWTGLYGGYTWHIFRWGGVPPTPPGPGSRIPIWLMFKMKYKGGRYNGF